MEILKGMVREKGFEDKECTYMKTDDGKQFYFIENFQLSNGNIIACSDLSQGVGNKPRETLGVITPRGDVIIPFENKMIKPLENNLLLVEKNTPTTPNVADALAKKDDPQAATSYMNDANTIKSQLKSVMAGGENYVFDNPFSEAALYTLEGVNVGGNYFSFIGQSGNDYYLSTNIVGSSILKYDSSVNMNSENTNEEMPTSNQENTVDQASSVPTATNDNAVSSSNQQQDVNSVSNDQIGNQNSESSLNQEPLVPNIEIPLQLQQQVEDTPSKEGEAALPSVDSSNVNSDTVSVPNDSSDQAQEQEVNPTTAPTDTTSEEIPKTELNIDLPLSDVLEENSQDTVANATDDNVTSTDDTNQKDSMVNIDGANLPNDNSSESDNTDLTNEGIQIPSTDQVEEGDSDAAVSNENQSSESLNISSVNMEETEEGDTKTDNSVDGGVDTESQLSENEDSTPFEENDNPSENTDEEEENDTEEDPSADGGMDIESQLPEKEDGTPLEEGDSTSENTDEEEGNDTEEDPSVDGGVDIESQLPDNEDSTSLEENENSSENMDGVGKENFSEENSLEKEEENEEESYEEYQEDELTNPVIIDATNTIRKLLEENRKQREIIDRQDSEIETLASSNSILKENNDSKSKEIISLRNSMAKYRNQNSTLSRENNNLKATNTRQEELIENLKSQNITLKEQVAGITALGNAVKEATTVIETHQEDFSEPSELSYLDTAMGEIAYQKRKTV